MSAAGWIKIHRGIIRDGWYQSLTDLQKLAWFNLLVTVNWQPSEFGCKNCGEIMELPAGATGKSINTLAGLFKQGAHVIRGMMDKAERHGTVTRRVKPRCHSVYVVVNWEKYQDVDIALTQPRHSLDTALTLEEEGKKGRKKPKASKAQSDVTALLQYYHDEYLERFGIKPVVTWNGADRKTAATLLNGRDMSEARRMVDGYLRDGDPWLSDNAHVFSLLPKRGAKYLVKKPRQKLPPDLTPVFPERDNIDA